MITLEVGGDDRIILVPDEPEGVEWSYAGSGRYDLDVSEGDGVSWSDAEYIPVHYTDRPYYDGSYEVVPKLAGQVLATKGKAMADDVTVDGIPSYRTTNPSGGYTVVIAED